MRAVNLLPADLRGARAGGGGGNGVFVLLALLGVALVLVTTYTLAVRSVTDKKNELTEVTAKAEATEARAGALEPYTRFARLRAKRVETIGSLARNRFNWPYALRETSRVLPKDVWLTNVVGTVAPGVAVPDASTGTTASLRGALPVPALEIAGCSFEQDDVARYLAELRRIEGVTRVSIATSEKTDSGGGSAGGSGDSADCRQGNARIPKFEAVVFFESSTATSSQTSGTTPTATPAPSTGTGK